MSLSRRGLPRPGRWPAWSSLGLAGGAVALAALLSGAFADDPGPGPADPPAEALTGFNGTSNGFEDQAAFKKDTETFEEVEAIVPNGLGPIYNATSCAGCHQNPVTGSSSQVAVLRAGHHQTDPSDPSHVVFVEPPGGSLIHQRAIDAAAQERTPPGYEVRALRISPSVLGDGFVEVLSDSDLLRVRDAQPAELRGLAVAVPVTVGLKSDGSGGFDVVERIGRFGWKCQEASLVNFCAGAYLNEMGVTSPLQPQENASNGQDVSEFDQVADPEDQVDPKDPDNKVHPFGDDVRAFTRFIRSSKAPPRDASLARTEDAREGEKLFRDNANLGCAICHQPDYTTPRAGSPIRPLHTAGASGQGSDMATVPPALGNKVFHPYSDFLLHDIGTGDGIAQTQHAQKPSRGAARRAKAPDDLMERLKIARVGANPFTGDRRVLAPEVPGLDQRTIHKIRTAPLWGLRVRPQLLHDGSAVTIDEAIRRHKGQAQPVTAKYIKMVQDRPDQARQIMIFLKSL